MSDVNLVRPEAAAADWTVPQDWSSYTAADHSIWNHLFARQAKLLPGRAAPDFLRGLDMLQMTRAGIPNFEELSERLMKATGWQVVAVPGLVPDEVFFDHLANRRFVAGNFIRRADQLDYLQEPDVFHDVFGHVPLLAHPVFADYMEAYGRGGQRAARLGAAHRLSRLYWYTVEFGLVRSDDALHLFGAGIASSYTESFFALRDPSPHRLAFDLKRVMRTRYRIDDFQQTYFVVDSFEDLLDSTLNTDFAPLYAQIADDEDLSGEEILVSDVVITRGTQSRMRHEAAS